MNENRGGLNDARPSSKRAGVEMFLFSKMTQGMWIMPGTRMPPSHELACKGV